MGYLIPVSLVFVLSNFNSLVLWIMLEVISLYVLFLVLRHSVRDVNMLGVVYYFLVQGVGGALLVFGIIYELGLYGNVYFAQVPLSYVGLCCGLGGLLMKMGLYPFYFWVVRVYKLLEGVQCYYVAVYPKIFPLIFLYGLMDVVGMGFFFFGGFSILLSGFLGLLVSDVREFMGLSSIGHGGWMLFCFFGGFMLLVIYFIVYYVCNYVFFNMMYGRGFGLFIGFGRGRLMMGISFVLFFVVMNLGGFAPSVGFILKLYIVTEVLGNWGLISCVILLFLTVAGIFFYVRFIQFLYNVNCNYQVIRVVSWKRWFRGCVQTGLLLFMIVLFWGLIVI
uniref:NADH-ubiquinone oxidoreductase chain 2 n=1 Tax=Halocynthia papillosa TaxID=201963 RepID=A0A1L7PNS7_HALPP|nr:NADH dehydrogenase subunit 2 [Halocynthia papillosa]